MNHDIPITKVAAGCAPRVCSSRYAPRVITAFFPSQPCPGRRLRRFSMRIARAPLHRGILALTLAIACFAPACESPPDSSATSAAPAASTCEAHGLAAATCPFCKPERVPDEGLCHEHGVPEALCWLCKPLLVAAFKKQDDWCGGHDRPESLCFICNPDRERAVAELMKVPVEPHDPAAQAASKGAGAITIESVDARLDASDLPRSNRVPSVTCTTSQHRIRLASTEIASRAGLTFERVERREVSQTLPCNAEIVYDGNRYARVAPRVSGVVQSVLKDVGEMVSPGDVLAVVDCAELAFAKAEYLQAVETNGLWEKNHAATHALVEKGIAGSQEDLAAESKLAEAGIGLSKAVQHLKVLGLSEEQIAAVGASRDTSPLLPIAAPFEGEVVERSAVMGEVADSARPLFAIADTRKMWAVLDVFERDMSGICTGQGVVIDVEGLRGDTFSGRIVWVSRQIDPTTRTLHARAEIDNAEGLLRANMFARATVTVHDRAPLLVMPRSAVQWDGCCNVAFVRVNETVFEPRKLRLGAEVGDVIEIRDGLAEGETVVTQGSFMLKTEIMKTSIGAGCCEASH